MMNGTTKVGTNGANGHAKHEPVPEADKDPLSFVDDHALSMKKAIGGAKTRGYVDGLTRAKKLIAIAAGRLDVQSRLQLDGVIEQLEKEAEDAAK